MKDVIAGLKRKKADLLRQAAKIDRALALLAEGEEEQPPRPPITDETRARMSEAQKRRHAGERNGDAKE